MAKTEFVKARIEPALKARGEAVLSAIGINTAEAINMFFSQIVMQRGLPFEAKIPNEESIEAFGEILDDKKRAELKSFASVDELMADLNS